MNRSRALIATLFATAFVLGGCASTKLDQPAPAATGAAGAGATTTPPQSQVTTVNTGNAAATGQAAENLARAIYFDFDSSVIKPEFQPTISGYAKLLSSGDRRLTIEGHTDERGSIEYNLALGQRRAEAVRKALALLGVRENQMEAVSYGEERPAVEGQGEEVWSQNRRAEFKLR
ncbi:peptidoglycan-associated lipoprotein Pal [Schlegelella aquatica]|uniref:peptidoglycan-associated lipoprotein Pal n=1 Tax=Caldimonas aquatica TaxID=376175 RepID=UPI00375334C3